MVAELCTLELLVALIPKPSYPRTVIFPVLESVDESKEIPCPDAVAFDMYIVPSFCT